MNKVSKKINASMTRPDTKPPRGSEVFVGKIPRDLTRQDLVPLFERVGPVHEVRLMLNRNGENRGFAFVTFSDPAVATRAIEALNNYEIRPRQHIGVIRSLDNCRLFLGGVPKDKTENEVFQEMTRLTNGVVRVIMYSSVTDKSRNRGFAFVEYESHKAAAIARRHCVSGNFQLWGKAVAVDWAEPEPVVDEEILSKVRILYVRNLLLSTKEEDLATLFNDASEGGLEKVKILSDFAFVHFKTREQAEKALATLQAYEMNGVRMQITWAKPMLRKKDPIAPKFLDKQSVPDHSLLHHSSAAVGNLNTTCAPPANYTYTVPQQTWPYLQFPSFPYPAYQHSAGMNHLNREPLIPIHDMQRSYVEPEAIPPSLPQGKALAWPAVPSLMPQQALMLTNEMAHYYGFPAAQPPNLFQQFLEQSSTTMLYAGLNRTSNNGNFHFTEVQQLS